MKEFPTELLWFTTSMYSLIKLIRTIGWWHLENKKLEMKKAKRQGK